MSDPLRLVLERFKATPNSTIGRLLIGDVFESYVLEDRLRLDDPTTPENEGAKVKHQTCIPAGTYQIVLTMSPRFKRVLPLLVGVPGFDGIRIHAGNDKDDTSGCLLPGDIVGEDVVHGSRKAFERIFGKLQTAAAQGRPITITIKNPA